MNDNDAIINFRLPKLERDAFNRLCHQRDLTSSQVLRAFVRDYISGQDKQTKLALKS